MAIDDCIPIIARAEQFGKRRALVTEEGIFTYHTLLDVSAKIATELLGGMTDLGEQRVAFLLPPGFPYVASQWGIWRAGGMAVPLAVNYPPPELEYVIDDSNVSMLVTCPEYEEKLNHLAASRGLRKLSLDLSRLPEAVSLPAVDPYRRAMTVYTSGTTGKPKGAVFTHRQLQTQVTNLVTAWEWTKDDHILHILPLHHMHGIVNLLLCPLWSGAVCEILPHFDTQKVWRRIADGGLTLFMAVPTVYTRLIQAWESLLPEDQKRSSAGAAAMRLMVSGSAALPVSVLEKWQSITGHVLLERYGTTEIGIALSNPVHGERVPGHVGRPLPGIEVRRVDEEGHVLAESEVPGELQARGPGVFLEYWGKPKETREAFIDGWFRTGDMVTIEKGIYRIMGRSSVDIIKTGGYKVSALDIEEILRRHPLIVECAVVGPSDQEWGQRVAAAVILKTGGELSLEELRPWAKERIAPYKVPSLLRIVDDLPRNAMGKVIKPEVIKLFEKP